MREGLVVIQVPGRYWSVTRVGWARRIVGDEWELLAARTITRTGAVATLATMAGKGLPKQHVLSEVDAAPELIHRLAVRRCFAADADAWAKDCPAPKDWSTK